VHEDVRCAHCDAATAARLMRALCAWFRHGANFQPMDNDMKILKVKLVTLIAITLMLSAPLGALENGVVTAGTAAFSCKLSAAEVIAKLTTQRMTSDSDASVSFNVTTTVMKNNKKTIKSVAGLPGQVQAPPHHGSTTAALTIPFSVADFRGDGSFNSAAFDTYVSHHLNKLQVPDTSTGLNCGGSPLGTTITEVYENCVPGKITTEYIGEIDPLSGDPNWMVKSSSQQPAEEAACNRHITKR